MINPFVVRASGSSSPAFDPDEARRALRLLVDPDARHELRGLPSGRSRLVSGSDLDAALAAATALADDRGVYYTLNPVRPDLGDRGAKNADVLRRVWLLVDVDPVRTDAATGEPVRDVSSTAEEKASAWFVTQAARAGLAADGWPAPVVVDSGNGFHLLYRVDLPNDKLAAQWVAGCLRALARRHDTAKATIDVKVHNAARIAKLPGTWSRKGPSTEDRPHRMCCLASVPDAIAPADPDLLVRLSGLAAPEPIGPPATPFVLPPDPWTVRAGNGSADAYARSAMDGEAGKVAMAPSERNNQLYESALKLGSLVGAGALDEAEVVHVLTAAARRAGLPDPADPDEVGRAIRNGLDVGKAAPRILPISPGVTRADTAGYAAPPPAGGRLTIWASEVRPKAVRWLWRDRVALNFISIFAGRTGLGKSFVTCDLAARLTTGRDLPDGPSGLPGECVNVLFISEDPYEYMLAPRLLELGADMGRVAFLRWDVLSRYTLADTDFLQRCYEETRRPTLIAIDPPTQFLGQADEHKNAEVRAVLARIVHWLEDKDTACVLITHVNKQVGKGVEALNRVLGSVAWTTSSRVAMSFSPDPEDPARCLFSGMKNNLGQTAKTQAYRIVGTETLATIEWLGPVDTTADEAMNGERRKPRGAVAGEWLEAMFRRQREWPARQLNALAAEVGVSKNALVEARRALPLRWHKIIDPHGDEYVVWRIIDPNWPPPERGRECRNVGNPEA